VGAVAVPLVQIQQVQPLAEVVVLLLNILMLQQYPGLYLLQGVLVLLVLGAHLLLGHFVLLQVDLVLLVLLLVVVALDLVGI
jgi:hypothetical protein